MPVTSPQPPKLKVNKPTQGAVTAHQDTPAPTPDQTPTTPPPKQKRTKDPVVTRGIGIKQSLLDQLEVIAKEQNLAVNSLCKFAFEYFVEQYQQGNAKQKIESRKKIRAFID